MMGPDIAKGANTQVSAQTCHQDGGNQVNKSVKQVSPSLCFFFFRFFFIQQEIKFILMNIVWNQLMEKQIPIEISFLMRVVMNKPNRIGNITNRLVFTSFRRISHWLVLVLDSSIGK